jgi:hypothetical protein
MKYLGEDEKYKYYIDYFNGNPMKFIVDKETDSLNVDGDSVAQLLGFNDFEEMINSSDDYMNLFLDELKNGGITIRDDDEDT